MLWKTVAKAVRAMFYSIRTQLIAIIVMLIVPFVLMGYFFWQQAADALRASIETTTVQSMNQYADFAESATSQLMNVANQILRSDETQEWLRSRDEPAASPNAVQQNIRMRKYFDSVVSNSPLILSVNIFHGGGICGTWRATIICAATGIPLIGTKASAGRERISIPGRTVRP